MQGSPVGVFYEGPHEGLLWDSFLELGWKWLLDSGRAWLVAVGDDIS